MSLLSHKSLLSNPLLSGKTDSSGLAATKRRASNDSQGQKVIPSKQKTPGMALSSGSLLLGSSLLGGNSSKGSKLGLGLRSSTLGLKPPRMENKLLSTGLTLQSKLLGGTTSTSPRSSATKPSSTHIGGASKPAKVSSHQIKEKARAAAVGESKPKKKVKSQHRLEQTTREQVTLDPTLTTCELPDYDFSRQLPVALVDPNKSKLSFDALNTGDEVNQTANVGNLTEFKQTFINAVSASLIGGPDFHQKGDGTRKNISQQAEVIISADPEFILKVALYTRKELNIRTTANFLLALAAITPDCRPFLRKYYSTSVGLPSDWIDIAELYQTFHDKNIHYGSLPSALRKAMVDRFPKFDQYQLAKYNKDKKKKKPTPNKPTEEETVEKTEEKEASDKEKDSDADEENDTDDEEEVERLSFTLKQLIRKLHIKEPVDSVMGLLGKRYPEDLEAFYQSRLPGTWDPERAGKRMKLPTPETWETQVSLKGNKAPVWEQLIDNKKLPFMAMLRNLRNMIAAGISEKHHKWVLYKLTDRGSVVYNKQFPFRFFSAYEVIRSLEYDLNKAEKLKEQEASGERPRSRARKGGKDKKDIPKWKQKKIEEKLKSLPYDLNLLNRYRKALDSAVKIATSYNVKPIPGKTLLLCHVGKSMGKPCTSARGLGKKRTVLEVGILLGLMCKYSCEDCTFLIYGGNTHRVVELEAGTILENMTSLLTQAQLMMASGAEGQSLDPTILGEILRDRVQLDNLVILSDSSKQEGGDADTVSLFLEKYRHVVNENLLYVNVDLTGARCSMSPTTPSHPNNIFIAGYSDQILRFIAERGDTGQVTHVQNIDKAYNLTDIKVKKGARESSCSPWTRVRPPTPCKTRRHHTIRVFISSTFRDMHGERDLLTRFVFPELRAKARARFVNIYEVDLRWGVNEEQTKHSSSVEICLQEANRCDIFLGVLGDRYGHVPTSHPDMSDDCDFDWLSTQSKSSSITELEMNYAALRHEPTGKAFFYVRSSDFLSEVPNRLRSQFVDEDAGSKQRLAKLKDTIRTSGYEVMDGYPCHYGGIVEGKPVVVGLEEFGKRVINNIWNYIEQTYPEEGEDIDDLHHEHHQHEMYLQSQLTTFTGREKQIKQCMDTVLKMESGVVVVTGKQGCGKTALMASVAAEFKMRIMESAFYEDHLIINHFVGAVPGSAHISSLLKRLCSELSDHFNLQPLVPQEYKNLVAEFPRFLEEAREYTDTMHKILIFIDGVSNLDPAHQSHNLDWLPQNLPENVVFILSAVSSSQAHAAAVRRQATEIELGPLDLMDKAEVVRKTLATYHKALDESAFNNQMKLLVSKREANLPLFLKLACEELRVFGVFEEVSARLKAMSHTIATLLQEVLKRLEDDHGQDLVTIALAVLVSSREGLPEEDLHNILSLHQRLKDTKYTYQNVVNCSLAPETMLPQAVMVRLVRGIKSLLAPTGEDSESRLTVSHGQISQAIIQRYMKGAASELQTRVHALMAGYFTHLSTTTSNGDISRVWSTSSPHALSELPYHLVQGGLFSCLEQTLSDPGFIEAKCLTGLASTLLDDFQANTSTNSKAILREREKFLSNPLIAALRSFISRNLHILTYCPGLLWQQAVNEPENSPVRSTVLASGRSSEKGMVVLKNNRASYDDCTLTLTGFTQAVLCVAIAPGHQVFAVGTKDCQLKLYDFETGKELRSFIGHSDAVTSCCFVGATRLMSASRDNTLSLWDVDQGYRVSVLKGHRGLVSGCIADPRGKNLASCGWDCRVLIWDGRTGKQTSDITEPRPINCLSYHPEGKLLVTGSWDATLKIWDTFNKKRVAILRGHKSSVRAVTYSPSGRHIASASLDGAVKLWSASSGTQVGSLCGHSQPINHIVFSHDGKQLVTVGNDHKTKIWSGNLGKQLAVFRGNKSSASTQAVFNPDGEIIAMGYHSGEVKVVEVSSRREIFHYQQRESRVRGLAWCDKLDGKRCLIVGYESGHVEILQNITEKVEVKPFKTSHAAVTFLAYSDATKTAAVCYDNMSVSLWSNPALSGKQPKGIDPTSVIHPKCNGAITCCAFNSDGSRLVIGTRDAMMFVYDIKDAKPTSNTPIMHLDNCHKDWINTCSWSPGTEFVATGSNDSTIKLWDMKTGKAKNTLVGHQGAVYSVAFSHGCVVSGCSDKTVKVWSHRGVEITTLHGHSQKVNTVDIHVRTDGNNGEGEEDLDSNEEEDQGAGVSWSDVMAGDEWKEQHQKKKLDKVSNVSLEDVIVATASDDGTTQLWKPLQVSNRTTLSEGTEETANNLESSHISNELTTLTGHSDRVLSVAMAPTGHVITTSMDCTVKVWKPRLSSDTNLVRGHDAEVTSVTMSTKTNFAISTSRDGTVCLWKVDGKNQAAGAGSLVLAHTWKAAECSVNAACFIGKHNSFFLGMDNGTIRKWTIEELNDKPGVYTTVRGPIRYLNDYTFRSMSSPVTCLEYDDSKDTLYVGSWSAVVNLRNASGKMKQNLKRMSDWVLDMQLTKKKCLVTAQADGKINFMTENRVEVDMKDHSSTWQYAVTQAPSQLGHDNWTGQVLTGSAEGGITSVEDDMTVENHVMLKFPVTGLGVTKHHIISASEDGTVKFWDNSSFTQVGQFFCPSPVRALSTLSESSDLVLCGDQLGNVSLLEWKQ